MPADSRARAGRDIRRADTRRADAHCSVRRRANAGIRRVPDFRRSGHCCAFDDHAVTELVPAKRS